MPKITILPHEHLCPDGVRFDVEPGANLCRALLKHGVEIEHACELSCACTTCHVIVRKGLNTLAPSEENEDDMLDKAWGLEPNSRLSCQAIVGRTPLVIEIPRYSINMIKEGKR